MDGALTTAENMSLYLPTSSTARAVPEHLSSTLLAIMNVRFGLPILVDSESGAVMACSAVYCEGSAGYCEGSAACATVRL